MVAGLAATLSDLDAVVVMGHEVEPSSRCLMSALESDAGYIGALGSAAMQQARADWLAYREVTDLSRVHGPAGLPIGGRSPAEVAVAIVAEILDERAD
jgi:xanthine dehydrogenase accessory factor